jgi:hypothetical protein
MRLNATWPLAVLTVGSGRVHLRVRPALFAAKPYDSSAGDLKEVFPCRGTFGSSGVGFRSYDGRLFYFWTGRRDAVLDACRSAGLPVSSEVRRATW